MGRFGKRLSLMSQAARSAMQSKGLKRFDTCSCHPRSWGLKKKLRRARRRLGCLVIREVVREIQES
jgi:hypothetical protein